MRYGNSNIVVDGNGERTISSLRPSYSVFWNKEGEIAIVDLRESDPESQMVVGIDPDAAENIARAILDLLTEDEEAEFESRAENDE